MLRAGLAVIAATFALTGAAAAQPRYGAAGSQPGYGAPSYDQDGDARSQGAYSPAFGDEEGDAAAARPRAGAQYGDADPQAPDLGRDLNLRPDQRTALQAYQAATTPSEAEQREMQADEQRLAAMTTPQRLDFAAAQMRRDAADFARRADAVRRFYAQLTPEQQRRFDQLTGPEAGGAPTGGEGAPGYEAGSPPR